VKRRGEEEGWGKEGSGLETERKACVCVGGGGVGGKERRKQIVSILVLTVHHVRVAFIFTNSHHTS
jgi:hypothetical protein